MRRALLLMVMTMVGGVVDPAGLVAQADADVARAEAFVRHLERGEFAAADSMVSAAMRQAGVTPPMLAQTWGQLTAQGGLSELRFESKTAMGAIQVVDFGARFGAQALTLRVAIDADGLVSGFRLLPAKPPAYEAPSYADTTSFEEVTLRIGEAPFQVEGTLTLPRGVAEAPAVVLVHGSGPHDRDETVGSTRPFRDLAWGLASRGVAVLRYDKRTFVHGAKLPADLTVEQEVIEDAIAALGAARAHERVADEEVYLLGHSLGGMLAPEIATRDPALRGVIVLAGTLRPLPELVLEQLEYLAGLEANAAPAAQSGIAELTAQMERIRERELPADSMAMGAPGSYYYDLMDRPATKFLAHVQVPMLVLQGGRDYQVTRQDYEVWERALAGRDDVRFEFYPELNHLFIAGTGMATPQEYLTGTGHVAPDVIEDIAEFVKR